MAINDRSFLPHSCSLHPQRKAIGLCVQCRTSMCSECSTRVDGINYCQNCLSTLHRLQSNQVPRHYRQLSLSNLFLILAGGLLIWGTFYLLGALWIRL
ncbi:MAG: B-box zinc finger protein [bacterium]